MKTVGGITPAEFRASSIASGSFAALSQMLRFAQDGLGSRHREPKSDFAPVLQFLAGDAVPRPWHGLQALLLDRLLAVDAQAVPAVLQARERLVAHPHQLSL